MVIVLSYFKFFLKNVCLWPLVSLSTISLSLSTITALKQSPWMLPYYLFIGSTDVTGSKPGLEKRDSGTGVFL